MFLKFVSPACFYLINFFFFFFNDTATTEIYTLSLHDALPILPSFCKVSSWNYQYLLTEHLPRSEEHTSELQSPLNLVCRLLLEKKKIDELLCPRQRARITLHHNATAQSPQ